MDKGTEYTEEHHKDLLEDQITLSNKLKAMEKEAELFKDQVKRQETILEKNRMENKRLLEKISEQDQLIRRHEIIIANIYPAMQNVAGKMLHLESENESLNKQLNNTSKKTLVERIKTLEKDVSRLESENEDLTEQKKALERDLNSMTMENKQVRESFQKLQNLMHEKSKNSCTTEDNDAVSGELKKFKLECEMSQETVQKLETTSQEVGNITANYEDNGISKEKFEKLQKEFLRIESENEELNQRNIKIDRQLHSLFVENNRQREIIQKYKQKNADQFDSELFESEVNAILTKDDVSKISDAIGMKTLVDRLLYENKALNIAMKSKQTLSEEFKNANQLEPPHDLKIKIESVIKENSKLNKELDEIYHQFAIEKTATNMSLLPARITSSIIKENKRLRSEIQILQKSKKQPEELKKIKNKLQSVEKENAKLAKDKTQLMEDKEKLSFEITKIKTKENTSQPADVDQTNTPLNLEQKNEEELIKTKLENSLLTQELEKMEKSQEKEKSLIKDLKNTLELKIADYDSQLKKYEGIQKTLYGYERKIRELTLENSDIRRENEAMFEGLTNKNKEIQMLQMKLIQAVQTRDIQFQNQITNHTDEKIKLNSVIVNIKSENKTIKADLENERKMRVKDQKLKTELDKKYQKLQNTHHKITNTLEINKQRQTELENDLKKLKDENGLLNSQLKEKNSEISQLQDQVQTLRDKVDESEDYERLHSTIEKNSQLEKELQHLKNVEEKLKLAETKIEQLESEIKSYKTEITTFEKKLNTMKSEGKRLLENLKSDKQQLKREKNQLVKEKNELSIEKNEMEVKFKTDIENLQSKLEFITAEINNTKKREVSVQTNEKYQEELVVLQEQNQYQQKEIENYSTTILITLDEIESLHNDLKSKETKINSLKGDLEGMELRITIMYRQLEHFKKSLPAWIEKLNQIAEFLNHSFTYNRRRSEITVVISEMFAIEFDLGKSLKFFDKTKIVKLSHYPDVIRELVETELSCSICTDTLKEAVTLKCSHTFCEKCLETWKNTKMECPMCRARFVSQYKTPLIDNVIEKIMVCFPKESQTDQNSDHYDEDFPALN